MGADRDSSVGWSVWVALPSLQQSPLERRFDTNDGAISLGFLDGNIQPVQIARFNPAEADLVVYITRGAKAEQRQTRTAVSGQRLAFVAFHRKPNESRPSTPGPGSSLRVYTAGGRSFLVNVPAGQNIHDKLGFYAESLQDSSPYREFYFYAHGVNAREMARPIGAMLVEAGIVDANNLKRGVDEQAAQKRVPLGQILVDSNKVDSQAIEKAVAAQPSRNMRLGEVLVEAGLARPEDIEFALAEQKRRGGRRIGEILVGLGLISEVTLAQTLAKKFHLEFIDLETHPVQLHAVADLPKEMIEKHKVLPIDASATTLTITIADPLAVHAIEAIRKHANKALIEKVATPSQLDKFIPLYLDRIESAALAGEMDEILKELQDDDSGNSDIDMEYGTVRESDSAVIKLANQIILDAYRRGASDIHIEPNGAEQRMSVRFRVDGDCVTYNELPPQYRAPLVARLKIMANLDISERRKPQDGKIRLKFGEKKMELRVATIPTVGNAEDVVLRILSTSRLLSLNESGLSANNLERFRQMITKPYGLILCVGPTGSGKTTTLHSALGAINTVDMKIWTAEDPVEITQSRLRQVQVNPKVGFTFANAMRAFLRADPDVIMVGEMRDLETASTAIEASLTGHLVFSTLHTNNAPETIVRLVDMGLDPFSFADALLGVLAQRLTRGLCRQCRESYVGSEAEYNELAQIYGEHEFKHKLGVMLGPTFRLWKAKGCPACSNTGYKGRIALHELLTADDGVKRAIQQKGSAEDIRILAKATGMTTLMQDGIEKVLAGLTDMKQVVAVCSR